MDGIEFIDPEEGDFAKRGRKPITDGALVDALKKCPTGKAVRLAKYAGDPKADDYKAHKAKYAGRIRACAKSAGVAVIVQWTMDGVPVVTVKDTGKPSPKKA